MVQIRTWLSHSPPIDNGGATFKIESEEEPPGRRTCHCCNKLHFGSCEKTHWKRVGPKQGEPTTKIISGKKWYYCVRCDRWNNTHFTEAHRTRQEIAEANGAQANLADGDDNSSLGTDDRSVTGSANFASYTMRSLRNRVSKASFASTVRSGMHRDGC